MNSESIFVPMMTLVAWTFAIMSFMAYKRFSAVFAGRVKPGQFKLGESPDVPADVRVVNRNFVNLFEMPVLFYLLCVALYATHRVSDAMVVLAWVYVVLRVVHSLIHVSYNQVMQRFLAYAASNLILMVMWITFAVTAHHAPRPWPFG